MRNVPLGRDWAVNDCLKFTDESGEHTGTIIRLVGDDRAIVHWDDGFRDSGVNLENCEAVA